MTEITFRPIDKWPDGWRHPDRGLLRAPSPFQAKYNDTLGLLDEELRHLGAVTSHVQLAGITAADLRQDGMLKARVKVDHPGVVLTVVPKLGPPMVLYTDQFRIQWADQGEDWHHNLRACVLGLRDLRRMTRYGLNGGNAQYAGFAALPSGGPMTLGSGMGVADAQQVLGEAAGWGHVVPETADEVAAAYRSAARRLHPDTSDGDAARMAEVNQARDVLVAHHLLAGGRG